MIQIEEQGRRLAITVGGEINLLIPPANAKTGAALLSAFLGIAGNLFEPDDEHEAENDLIALALGRPTFEDAENPTDAENAKMAEYSELRALVDDLRSEEQFEVINAAFFWNAQGGSFTAATTFLQDGLSKALDLLTERSGLATLSMLTSSSSASATTPPAGPATSTQSGTGAPSRPTGVKQPQDHKRPRSKPAG